jgi:hypothetical protein
MGPKADEAAIPNNTAAEMNRNGFSTATSSVANADSMHLATETFSRRDYMPNITAINSMGI